MRRPRRRMRPWDRKTNTLNKYDLGYDLLRVPKKKTVSRTLRIFTSW